MKKDKNARKHGAKFGYMGDGSDSEEEGSDAGKMAMKNKRESNFVKDQKN